MLLIVLIPSAAMFITGATVAGSLISEGLSARSLASYMQQNVGPIVQLESAIGQERMISLRALGADPQAQAGLSKQWAETDAVLARSAQIGDTAQRLNPSAAASANAKFHQLVAQLPAIRQGVQSRRESPAAVDAFYTQLAGVVTPAFLGFALSAYSSAAAVDGITMLDLLPVVDTHSRAVGLGAGRAASGTLTQSDRLQMAQLTGAYRNQLQDLTSRLNGSEMADYGRLLKGSAWQVATSGEDDLARNGKLAMPAASWLAAEDSVSAGLLGLWGDSLHQAEASAMAAANATLSRAALLGSALLVLSVAAFAAAMVLANGLVRRLRRLRAQTLELADVTLPAMVRRIASGEQVDPELEMAMFDHGGDEIGNVAQAFSTAQRTAVAAAVAEARTRSGFNNVFLDIAHRSQMVVHRQLELLDIAEAKQSNPEHLELLFKLDHLAIRARRNAENLLILGGGQPGRKWRRAAVLEDVVRSAVSETEHFARVSTVRVPSLRMQGSVVGDFIHLLAELVDNATAFSPPDAEVIVRGNLVGKGVVIEVEDQGLGIEFAERERLNQALADPPDFQSLALSGQRHLGLFVVAHLAHRHGITVTLLESAYGGIKAIVLIPSDVLEADGVVADSPPVTGGSGRHGQPRGISAAAGPGPVPHPHDGEGMTRRPGPGPRQGPAAAHAPSSQPRPGLHAPDAPQVLRPTAPGPQSGPSRRNRAPLPRRERLANLAPGLQPGTEGPRGVAPRQSRSPEETRGSMAAFQRGTRRARDLSAQETNESE
ncbi:MAG TPA: nitrate- and nitrite sensing domain-containing protein [Trebonia sp.]|nr:nitrate- and nitrite sensing domain-containing protein [Trebonia sp.]